MNTSKLFLKMLLIDIAFLKKGGVKLRKSVILQENGETNVQNLVFIRVFAKNIYELHTRVPKF